MSYFFENGPSLHVVHTVRNAKGELHRENDCARIYANGTKEYWQNGKLHRIGGPAIEYLPNRLGGEAKPDEFWEYGVRIR